ncbi:hypothetical protein SUDANB15_02522 [Streptomyces sp. enrichment culture]|uniref:DUF2637 domain-containing protein n=1 Tax=Streptomyces sp. enrichment culture TaxID=1795815 RepID=UPI003F5703B6
MTVADSPRRLVWDAQKVIAVSAALVTIVLTVVAFWLSYEHLHDLAGRHQLHGRRAWAWPATVDLFIAVGELLVLRASLAGQTDKFAIALTSLGSLGSIALNVAAAGSKAAVLDYVVAAVPPVAALLAFGALMLQLRDHLTATTGSDSTSSISTGVTTVAPNMTGPTVNVSASPWKPSVIKAMPALPPSTVKPVKAALTPRLGKVTARVDEEPKEVPESPRKPSADQVIRRLYDELGGRRPTTRHIRQALADAGLPNSDGSCRQARLRVEQKEPELKELPPA